tara:strand:- start:1396 stop:2028 length:633 start_codon:yes stop_codon:yes gene_type:complete
MLPDSMKKSFNEDFILLDSHRDLTKEKITSIDPKYIFFPHWSNIIKEEIYSHYNCIVFHMTDLPYGRGGSPLQNLIVKGHKKTMISAIKCEAGLDTGPVYLKKPLNLEGSAKDIFNRSTSVIQEMIISIIKNNYKPKPQVGKVVNFKRRKPSDGDWSKVKSLEEVYNFIRMLDSEDYPSAFVNIGEFKLEFSEAIKSSTTLKATVVISKS